jgi:dUTP pyrophosphatase
MATKKTDQDETTTVGVKLNHRFARIPVYAHGNGEDAGCDLYSVEQVRLNPADVVVVHTGLSLTFAVPLEAQVRSRSGLAAKGIIVANSPGTIDPSYRGEIGVILVNVGRNPYDVQIGDRIAQLVFSKYEPVTYSIVQELDKTVRGESGLGDSGR